MRQSINTPFRIENGMRMPVRKPVSAPNRSFIARGTAFRAASRRLRWTIIVIWTEGQADPWIALTDLPPSEAGASWRSPRVRIETGFKALKSVGRQRRKTRRTDPVRVERNRLALAAATPLTLAAGSRAEDAQALKKSPRALRSPPKAAPERNRITGVFRLGLAALSRLLTKGGMYRRLCRCPNRDRRRQRD